MLRKYTVNSRPLIGKPIKDQSTAAPEIRFSQGWKEKKIISGCKIFSIKGDLIKTFPGELCIFLKDGRFVSATSDALTMFNFDSKVLWKIPGHFHHQLNLSQDGKSILAISSENIKEKQKLVRYCVLMQIGLDGKVIHLLSTKKMLEELNLKPLEWQSYWDKSMLSDIEATHFNSFYEIPEQISSSSLFRAGDFIANSLELGVFIISKDFSRVINHFLIERSVRNNVHDVQIDRKGFLIYFNNLHKDQKESLYSTVDIFDSKMKKLFFEFKANPKEMFFSPACGGVQVLDDHHILISTRLGGFFVYNMNLKKVVFSNLMSTGMLNWEPFLAQQFKLIDLNEFLSFWL